MLKDEINKKSSKKREKKTQVNSTNMLNLWYRLWDQDNFIQKF
jgi:hypothetical protein